MYIVPIFSSTSSQFIIEAELGGSNWILGLRYNARDVSWYLSISDNNDNLVLSGIKLVPTYPLIERYRYIPNLPNGDFIVMDLDESPGGSVNFDNLGTRYQLVFFTQEEIDGIQ